MKKKIITVDDEYQTRDYISAVIVENGYVPLQAKNGDEAMDIIKRERPDLVILDVLMPEKSGIKLYRELKTTESLKDIPVVICSGISRRTFIRTQAGPSGRDAGSVPEPDGYIEKPVKPVTLSKIIKKLIG